MSESQS